MLLTCQINRLLHQLVLILLLIGLTIACSQKKQKAISPFGPTNINLNESEMVSDSQFMVSGIGDTILTGVTVPVQGKLIKPDSVAQPKTIALRSLPKTVPAYKNVHPVATPRVRKIPKALKIISPGKEGVPLAKTVPARGKSVPVKQPIPELALPLKMKESAISDIQYLDLNQGMNSSYVWSVIEDSKGNLWFGTGTGGVSRYDGRYLTHYTTQEGLSNNTLRAMMEDSQGNLWFATDGGGVNKYDGIQFTHFTTAEGLSDNVIYSLLEDSHGSIWIGSRIGGVIRYDPPAEKGGIGTFTQFTEKEGLSHNTVRSIFEDSQGHLWFGTIGGGVTHYNPSEGGRFIHYTVEEGLANNIVRSILEDKQGHLWFGTAGGLSQFQPSEDGLGELFVNYTRQQGLSDDVVWTMLKDRQENLWIGTRDGGVCKFDGKSFTHYTTREGLNNNWITSLVEDSYGNFWLGTRGGGVNRINDQSFSHFTSKEGLNNDWITTIFEDHKENLWFGSLGGGVSQYTGQHFVHFTTEQGLKNNNVRAIQEDGNGNLWFGMDGGGLYRYNSPQLLNTDSEKWPISGKIEFAKKNAYALGFTQWTVKEGLTHNSVWSLLVDSHDNVWAGTWFGGATRLDLGQNNQTHFSMEEGLISNTIWSILEDRQGNIWLGTRAGGASKLASKNFTLGNKLAEAHLEESYVTHYTTKEGLCHNSITTMLEDSRGRLWFGTDGGGLCQLDPSENPFNGQSGSRKRFTHYTSEDGLSDNRVLSIIEDQKKFIWVSTQKGITVLIPSNKLTSLMADVPEEKEYIFFSFSSGEGLKKLNFERNSACLDSKNRIWWGSTDGVTMLNLNKFELPTQAPRVVLNHIEINDTFIDFHRLNDKAKARQHSLEEDFSHYIDGAVPFYNYPNSLELPYRFNHLSFHFSAIDWSASQQKIKYSYFLEGLDKKWSLSQRDNKVDFRNIPFGDYTFKVKAIGGAELWSEVLEYRFTILPPWWHSWWARSLYVIFGLLSIFAYVNWRTLALKKRQKELERTVEERTTELAAQKDELAHKNELIIIEKERSDNLLLNILPLETAEELKQHGVAKAKNYEMVSVLFTDFKDFTLHSERLEPEKLVAEIDHCFKAFDQIMEKHNVEKIKTVGDAYMAAGGLPVPNTSNPADAVNAALAIRDFMQQYQSERKAEGREAFEIRIGVHTGPVVAGIVGIKKFAYDIWGDTVNLASRMENSGKVGKVNISQSTYEHLKGHPDFKFQPRGKIKAKNKGELEMYFAELA